MTKKVPAQIVASLLVLAACGGGTVAVAPHPSEESGGEVARVAPTGPPRSYVSEEHRVVVRLDMERVRGSALSNDIGSLVRSYPQWRELLGRSGIDPVQDFDRVLVAAPEVVTERTVMLIRHHLTNARIREAVLQMAVERGERPAWREVSGFSVVDWPAETRAPVVVVLTGENELVVTTPDQLSHVIEIASDHAARRTADELIEPALGLEDGLIASVIASTVNQEGRARQMRFPPQAFRVFVRRDAAQEGRIVLEAQGTYADEQSATAARTYYEGQRDMYAGQMLVRAVGLDRPLREARIQSQGNVVDVNASLTEDEIQRVLGLLALGQLGGG